MSLQEQVHDLFEDQKSSWPLLGSNWSRLDEAKIKVFEYEGFTVKVQCNPKRITSSAAKLDKTSIEQRACFLCKENRPPEEKEVKAGEDFEILCNPFPIFREHFTIAKNAHVPQVIESEFGNMLDLSKELPDLAVFYNAPNCGASAPDHMHFQAGIRGFMPMEEELEGMLERYGKLIYKKENVRVEAVDDGLRRFYVLSSAWKDSLEDVGLSLLKVLRVMKEDEEPMVNIISYYNDSAWRVLFFPRDKHRPWQYFEEGEKNILLSPASVDMGGSLIVPLEKDFEKISTEDITDIFGQLTFSSGNFKKMNKVIKHFNQ